MCYSFLRSQNYCSDHVFLLQKLVFIWTQCSTLAKSHPSSWFYFNDAHYFYHQVQLNWLVWKNFALARLTDIGWKLALNYSLWLLLCMHTFIANVKGVKYAYLRNSHLRLESFSKHSTYLQEYITFGPCAYSCGLCPNIRNSQFKICERTHYWLVLLLKVYFAYKMNDDASDVRNNVEHWSCLFGKSRA